MLKKLALALLMIIGAAAAAKAEQIFPEPTFDGFRVDWCRVWGGECGQPAADEFCRRQGYSGSTRFEQARDIGAATPTRVLTSRQVCADAGCDGFVYIACAPNQQKFLQPTFEGFRLDWCRVWGGECGAPAALAYCQSKGFNRVVDSQIDYDIGAASPTRVIGTRQVCADAGCDGFAYITCGN